MSSYRNPQPDRITDAVGVDAAIQQLGDTLVAGLPWLTHWLGRARPMPRRKGSKTETYPAVWNKVRSYYDGMPNDALAAQAFVVVNDPVEPVGDWLPGSRSNELNARCSLIVWANTSAVFPEHPGPRVEELLIQAREVLAGAEGVAPGRSYESAAEVFRGFTLPDLGAVAWLALPFGGFRLDFTLRYPSRPC